MSVVEDVRKVLQDTLAPDLKALTVRVEDLERRMDLRFQALEQRFDDQRTYLEKRFDGLERMLSQQQLISSLAERIHILETVARSAPAARKEAEIERAG
jgi:hypothetical protein